MFKHLFTSRRARTLKCIEETLHMYEAFYERIPESPTDGFIKLNTAGFIVELRHFCDLLRGTAKPKSQ